MLNSHKSKVELSWWIMEKPIIDHPIRNSTKSFPNLVDEEEITEELWPGATVLPVMSTGATDSTFFRSAGIPVYGVSGIFTDERDNRRHGRDERMLISSFYEGLEFLYRLTSKIAVLQDEPKPNQEGS